MARQEQDFSKETNRQSTILFIKDSEGVTIDLIETQCSQVLQSLLTLSDLQRRLKSLNQPGGRGPNLLKHPLRLPDGEMQDVEVNSLLQGQSIHIENCTDVESASGRSRWRKLLRSTWRCCGSWSVRSAGSPWLETVPARWPDDELVRCLPPRRWRRGMIGLEHR